MSTQSDHRPIVVADFPLPPNILSMLSEHVRLVSWDHALAGGAPEAAGIFTYRSPLVDRELFDRLALLRIISNYGTGLDHIDLEEATRRGIEVACTPAVIEDSVADLAFALLLAVARRIVECDRCVRNADLDDPYATRFLGRELTGTTMGIIGLGKIGMAVARRSVGFSINVAYYSRRRRSPEELAHLGCRPTYMKIDELLSNSDVIVLCVPLTAETIGMIGERELRSIKPRAILINVSRGQIVDTNALTEALVDGRLGAAALDVTSPEPLSRDHVLRTLPNVVITPHLGSATEEARRRMDEHSVKNLLTGLSEKRQVAHIFRQKDKQADLA